MSLLADLLSKIKQRETKRDVPPNLKNIVQGSAQKSAGRRRFILLSVLLAVAILTGIFLVYFTKTLSEQSDSDISAPLQGVPPAMQRHLSAEGGINQEMTGAEKPAANAQTGETETRKEQNNLEVAVPRKPPVVADSPPVPERKAGDILPGIEQVIVRKEPSGKNRNESEIDAYLYSAREYELRRDYQGALMNYEKILALVEARHFFSKFTPVAAERALVCLRRALSLDPDYPDALDLLAFYQFMMGYMFANPLEVLPQVKRLAGRALELDPHHGEAQSAVAVAAMWTDWDWLACERHHRRALELAPASARAHELYGLSSLLATGRLEEALAELDRAVELDPLSALYAGNRGRVLTCLRRFAEAEETCRRGLALDPGQLLVQVELIYALTFQERFEEAVAMGRKAIADNGLVKAPLNALALALALAGERNEAWQLLDAGGEAGRVAYRSPLTQGLVHAVCSEMESAIECVQRAVDEREPLLWYLRVHPMFDALRADPRYPELLRRVNLDSGGQA